ncbi:MAG: hypothetical protein FJ225_05420 [Lentisphaerae bacterium]|nr:hypothetical protein [Lentisphaerota bacterium]
MPETPGQRAPDAPQAPDVRAAQPAAEVPVARLRVRGPPALEEVENRRAADMLGQWIATYGATILTWMKDADIDDATYDRAILSAVQRMSYAKGPEAAALFTAFVTAGRMDRMTDAGLYAHAVSAAKGLGAVFGAMDYPAALEWGFALPEGSAAQAYVLSNVAFSQSHGAALPSLPWIKDMHPGFARVRVIAALAYGRMLAARDTVLTPEIKRQLDSDEFIPARLSEIVRESALPAEEKRVLLALL